MIGRVAAINGDTNEYFCNAQSSRDTELLLSILKKRYHNEQAILDYIEMIECEVMALRQVGSP
jgi:hypothetical protein